MKKLMHLAVFALLPAGALAGSAGDLDPSFGVGGWVTTDIEDGSYDQYGAAVTQPDGKLIVAGYRNISGGNQLAVVRYLENGDLDGTFGSGGKVILNAHLNEFASDVSLQPDGKILVAGSGDGLTDRAILVRLTTSGALDASFDDDGIVAINFGFNDTFRDILEVTQSHILVAGTGGLARFNLDGSLDTSFGGGDGILPVEEPEIDGRPVSRRRNALQSSGKLVAVGSYLPNLQPAQIVLQRYDTDGSLDQTFGTDVAMFNEYGPTEAGVGCMIHEADDADEGPHVPSGRPMPGVS